jgi:hypothetical protein
MGQATPFHKVSGDKQWVSEQISGRFTVPIEYVRSSAHFRSAAKKNWDILRTWMEKTGYRHDGGVPIIEGPLEHLTISEDVSPDPGPQAMPDPRDEKAIAAWRQAEFARVSHKLTNILQEKVDYVIHANFLTQITLPSIISRRR